MSKAPNHTEQSAFAHLPLKGIVRLAVAHAQIDGFMNPGWWGGWYCGLSYVGSQVGNVVHRCVCVRVCVCVCVSVCLSIHQPVV